MTTAPEAVVPFKCAAAHLTLPEDLVEAAEAGNQTKVLAYLEQGGHVDARHRGSTMLLCAASRGRAALCKLFLQRRADPDRSRSQPSQRLRTRARSERTRARARRCRTRSRSAACGRGFLILRKIAVFGPEF